MGVYIKGMEMPKDCPMCPMSHWDVGDNFRGCKIVPGKKHAIRDPEYANSDHRPNWCPLAPVPPHGRLIDADALIEKVIAKYLEHERKGEFVFAAAEIKQDIVDLISNAPTIIEAEEGE